MRQSNYKCSLSQSQVQADGFRKKLNNDIFKISSNLDYQVKKCKKGYTGCNFATVPLSSKNSFAKSQRFSTESQQFLAFERDLIKKRIDQTSKIQDSLEQTQQRAEETQQYLEKQINEVQQDLEQIDELYNPKKKKQEISPSKVKGFHSDLYNQGKKDPDSARLAQQQKQAARHKNAQSMRDNYSIGRPQTSQNQRIYTQESPNKTKSSWKQQQMKRFPNSAHRLNYESPYSKKELWAKDPFNNPESSKFRAFDNFYFNNTPIASNRYASEEKTKRPISSRNKGQFQFRIKRESVEPNHEKLEKICKKIENVDIKYDNIGYRKRWYNILVKNFTDAEEFVEEF